MITLFIIKIHKKSDKHVDIDSKDAYFIIFMIKKINKN